MEPKVLLHRGEIYVQAADKTLYFAYGSNMDRAQMKRRCPDSKYVGKAVLKGYRLGFTGHSNNWGGAVATITKGEGSVPGILYKVTDADIENLDRFEGYPTVYQRKTVKVGGQDALIYLRSLKSPKPVGPAYLVKLWRAYKENGFDFEPLIEAVAEGTDG